MTNKELLLLLAIPLFLFAGEVKQDYFFSTPIVCGNTVTMKDCHLFFSPFAPEIPAKSIRLLLADGQVPVSYSVSFDGPVTLAGSYSVRPYRPEIRIGSKPPANFLLRKSAAFSSNVFFPPQGSSASFDVQYKNGHPVFMAQIYPVQHNPVTGQVRYYSKMTVMVRTSEGLYGSQPVVVKTTPAIRSELAVLVDNPSGIAKLAATVVTPDDYEYLIVTTDSLKNGFSAFIDFNTRRGMRTKVVTLQSIKTLFATGYIDDQERIRAYIKKEYADCNIQYVLLAGDAEASSPNRIPDRKLYSEDWDYNYSGKPEDFSADSIPADMYYGCLDDAPHDWRPAAGKTVWGDYGTEDVTFEVAVGRFPVDNATELNTLISKTIRYSEQPVESLCTRVLLAGELLWGPPDHPVSCYGDEEMEQLVGTCSLTYGPLTGFTPGIWRITRLYDKAHVWNFDEFADSLRKSKAAIINHEGHTNAMLLARATTGSMTTAAFPQNGTPETGNYFVALSGGCYPGAFDNDNMGAVGGECVAEHLTKGLKTSAVAALFNSRYGFGSDGSNGVIPTDGSEQRLRRYWHHGLLGLGIHTLGKLDAYSKEINKSIWTNPSITRYESYFGQMKWETYEKNIIGDPALSVWTDAPRVLIPGLPSPLTAAAFSIQVPRYTTVALADPATGRIIVSATSGDAGLLTIENDVLTAWLQTYPSGQLKVIIKAHNYYPWSGTVQCNITNHLSGPQLLPASVFGIKIINQTVRYTLAKASSVFIEFFNARGVRVMHKGMKEPAGQHTIFINNQGLSKGMYYCRLTVGREIWNGKILIIK
jgi:hypothetical protein